MIFILVQKFSFMAHVSVIPSFQKPPGSIRFLQRSPLTSLYKGDSIHTQSKLTSWWLFLLNTEVLQASDS